MNVMRGVAENRAPPHPSSETSAPLCSPSLKPKTQRHYHFTHSLDSQLIRNRCLCHGQEGSSTEAAGAGGGTGDAGAAAAASLDLLLLLLLCSLTAAAAPPWEGSSWSDGPRRLLLLCTQLHSYSSLSPSQSSAAASAASQSSTLSRLE